MGPIQFIQMQSAGELFTPFNIALVLFITGMPFIPYLIGFLPERLHLKKMAQEFRKTHPSSEQKCVYVAFHSKGWTSKQLELDARVTEMRNHGWTFLGAAQSNPLRTLISWWGGMNLHFIRPQSDWQKQTIPEGISKNGYS